MNKRGFTLIELLVVIAIIVLLVGILVPIVQAVLDNAEDVRTQGRIVELSGGCESYRSETSYCPGQLYIDRIGECGGSDLDSDPLTGSQYLAITLFDELKRYAEAKADDLITVKGETDGGGSIDLVKSISDRNSEAMAILYYPARLGVDGLGQYHPEHNVEYVRGGNGDPDAFTDFVKDSRFGGGARPQNPGAYVLIAAGKDRLYFTADDVTYPKWK